MTGDFLVAILGAALAVALALAVYTDIRWRIIPNELNLAIALAAPLAWWAQGIDPWPGMAIQLAIGTAFFAVFLLQFHFNIMGGGDVKLVGALALWIAPSMIIEFVYVFAGASAVLSIGMMVALRLRGERVFADGVRLRLPDDEDENAEPVSHARLSPYGLAIAVGGWWVVHQQYLNHFPPIAGG